MAPAPDGADAPALVRRAGGQRLRAWHWHSVAQLQAAIGWRDPAECLCADLALGAWRGHWLAREWGAQLGASAPAPPQPALGTDEDDGRHADTVARLIDNESAGDLNFIAAWRCAVSVLAAVRAGRVRYVLLVAPLPGQAWGQENLQLVRLLCDAARDGGFTFGLLLRADAPAPVLAEFEVVLQTAPAAVAAAPCWPVPGILDAPPDAAGIETLPLAGGRRLVSPNCRPLAWPAVAPGPLPAHLPDALHVPFALQAPVQDVAFLRRQASLRFAEGGYELALAILDGIRVDALDPLQAALVAAHKQNIAIALMDFARAAEGPVPADDLPDAVRASLCQSRAWGLVMTGDAAGAEPWFARARQLLDPVRERRLYLYLPNISALAKLRLGDAATALAYERDIERRLLEMARPDWHLVYINCLNQARIFKKQGDYRQAERCYARGLHVTHQLRNESDLLYTNLCQAQLAALQGQDEAALAHWLRAVLHWLSNPWPEALAPRVAQAVLGRPLSNRAGGVEPIAQALAAQLRGACLRIGIDPAPAARAIPLHRVTPGSRPDACIGQPGWSVLASARDHGPMPFDGPAYAALNRLAVGLLDALAPGTGLADAGALLTDDRDGIDLPASPREVLWSCLRWRVPLLRFAARDYRLPGRETAAADLLVERSRAIDAIETGSDPWRVHFRRYLAPRVLAPDEQACLARLERLERPPRLAELAPLLGCGMAEAIDLVVRMSDRRLLTVA